MGYPYPKFCLCAFWGPIGVNGRDFCGEKGSGFVLKRRGKRDLVSKDKGFVGKVQSSDLGFRV